MKRVKCKELETLLRELFTKACKENGFKHHEMSIQLQLNSIYGKLEFSFKDSIKASTRKAQLIAEDFSNKLRHYTGKNITVNSQLGETENDSHILILQIDYDIVE